MAPYNTPQAIRPLEKTICDFAYSNGYDPISVFNDFLRYVIHGFSPGAPPLMDWKYKRQQNRHFMEMLTGWIRLMQRELQSGGWFDAFGDLFMAISSKIGRQVNGQFFTPPDICDLMVLCTDSGETATGKRICDPTCGSGRLLLAYHVRHLGNYLVAEDVKFTVKDTGEIQKVVMKDEAKPEETPTETPTETPEITPTPETKTTEETKKSTSPKTGDNTPILFWILLAGGGMAGLGGTVILRKKKK